MKQKFAPFAISTILLALALFGYTELYSFSDFASWPAWVLFIPGESIAAFVLLLPAAILPKSETSSVASVLFTAAIAPLIVVAISVVRLDLPDPLFQAVKLYGKYFISSIFLPAVCAIVVGVVLRQLVRRKAAN